MIFGVVEVESPYLWHKKEGWGVRPVKEKLGIKQGKPSPSVKRALSDFGAEESFGQAAKRFEEHYGWKIERGSLRREVGQTAELALTYLESRLLVLANRFKNLREPKQRSGWNRILVELDGCQIRTGISVTGKTEELTPIR